MDVAVRRPGKGREQERKLEGNAVRSSPSPCPLPQGEGVYVREVLESWPLCELAQKFPPSQII